MKTNYVLIDFENVQVKSLALLKGDKFEVKVFIGPKNSRLPVELVLAMHDLGNRADYIQLGVSGANALDFHITYYLGKLTAKHPEGQFHIISKDTGFDSLIKHLQSKGIHCKRSPSIEQMLGVGPATLAAGHVAAHVAGSKKEDSKKPEPRKAEHKKTEPKKPEPRKAAAKPATAAHKPKVVHPALVESTKHNGPVSGTMQTIIDNLQSRGAARPRTIKTLTSSIKTLRLNLSDEEIAATIAELQAFGKIKINGVQVAYKL